jgi:hypothetical protein
MTALLRWLPLLVIAAALVGVWIGVALFDAISA